PLARQTDACPPFGSSHQFILDTFVKFDNLVKDGFSSSIGCVSTTGGADDYRLYYVHFAKAHHSRGSSQHLPEHRAKVSRRTRFVSEDLRAISRRVNRRWCLPLEFEARGRSNVHRIMALIRPRDVRH